MSGERAPVFSDTRTAAHVSVEDGEITEGVMGGYGPWKITPPLVSVVGHGFVDGEYLCEPLPMSQDELRRQYEWAMQRSDRAPYRPVKAK